MNKCHTPITWQNGAAPAINATNLGQYDHELDTLDDRIIDLNAGSASAPFISKSFSALANTGHSATSDVIIIADNNINAGDTYNLYIKQTGTRTYRMFFTYADGSSSSSSFTTASVNKLNITTPKALSQIGIEVTSTGSASDFYVMLSKEPYGKDIIDLIESDIPSQMQQLKRSMSGTSVLETSFTVASNIGHSESTDVITIDLEPNDIVRLTVFQTGLRAYKVVSFFSDGTSSTSSFYNDEKRTWTITNSKEITGIGIGVTSAAGNSDFTVAVELGDGVFRQFRTLSGVAFGTSLTYRSQTTGGFLNYLPLLSGINFDNQGIGSATILHRDQAPSLDILAAVKSYSDYSDKSVCLLEGFVNDWYYNADKLGTYKDKTETTVCGCVRSAIDYIMSQNPDITLFLILDHCGRNYGGVDSSSTAVNSEGATQYEWWVEIAKVAESLCIPVINEYETSRICENTPQYLLDNIHCDDLGSKQSAYAIWSQMRQHYPNCVSDEPVVVNTVYGFHIDGSESDPNQRVTYIEDAVGLTPAYMDYANDEFNYGSWEDAFFMPRPCMLNSDGTVAYYLNPDDYSKKTDGTASDIENTSFNGNAMMEWGRDGKKIWIKIAPSNDGNSADIYIADAKINDDFHDWAFINNQGDEVDHFYTSIYNGSLVSNNIRSLSNQQISSGQTAQNQVTSCRNNNLGQNVLWNTEVYADIQLVNLLLILIGKSTNTQAVFGKGLCSGGSQAINNAFRTGVHNAKGLFYGTNSSTSSTYTNAVKVFGMENWWGLQWRRFAGFISVNGTEKYKLTYGTQDGSTASEYNFDGTGYKSSGVTPGGTNGGCIYVDKFTTDGMFPNTGNGVDDFTVYDCDGIWYNNSATGYAYRCGASVDGDAIGALALTLNVPTSSAGWWIGCTLSCKPLTT